ncbi:MAG: hypothetical protein ACMUHY_03805 [Thermoplasmatota archaeon]
MGRKAAAHRILMFLLVIAVLIISIDDITAGPAEKDPVYRQPLAPKAPMDPEVWVEVEYEEYEMIVEPGAARATPIRAWVYCETPPGFPPGEKVTVLVDVLGPWRVITQFIFVFDKTSDVAEMYLEVQPRIGASTEHVWEIHFVPRWSINTPQRSGGGTPDTAIIRPLPYGSVRIMDMDPVRFNVGEGQKVEIVVENNGNCEARITIGVEDDAGFDIAFPEMIFIVQERSFGTYEIWIKQTSGGGKEGKLLISATSSIPGMMSRDEVELHYETRGRVEVFFTNPLVNVFLLLLMAVFIASVVMFVRWRQKRNESRL